MNIDNTLSEETLMDCDIDDETLQFIGPSKSIEKPKAHKRKKLRRLVDNGNMDKNKRSSHKCKRILIITALITFTIALLMGHYFTQNNSNTKQILKEFLKNYRNQYTEIVHGKNNYCDQKQPLDTATLFARIKQNHILHQEQAMQHIEVALRNESDLNAIALVGPTGVGKTLFMGALQENFPWQENVHTYAWNTYVKDEAEKFHLIRILIENLSECGQNLLVIENLQACDHGVIPIINQLLIEANKKQHKRVVIFYVFNLNTMLTAEAYATQKNLLQSLPDCQVINFKSFKQAELRDCIKRESEIEHVTLGKQDYDEIVETIDPLKSGCKNVNAKVLMYHTIKNKKDNN
ncbi:uncharacterized protein LOC111685259 [Lucilia cuprina]|uniref:uncharacterized protein LOC111685259 n=1 Tax=Lucilia cuprina TaxID=7375 RepID=UPI001F0549EF|nr:uncharacterized protein LOC111685259 [Lucilia cuprina]